MLSNEEKEFLLAEMRELLEEYDYLYNDDALEEIIDEWASQKSVLIEAFKKHPNYIGNFMIAFNRDYERTINKYILELFGEYLYYKCIRQMRGIPADVEEKRKAQHRDWLPVYTFDFLVYPQRYANRVISKDIAEKLNDEIPTIHAHEGQKTTRVFNKICTYLGYDKEADYNREFAKFADALSPIKIKRHTVLSLNPLDYLTMSFGNSWASCHTIDKANKRQMPNNYSGCYSSGTISYMLDKSSIVFYTVDGAYDGATYYKQPKITRQMYHWGEEKLVQGRLYPQDNDGAFSQYDEYRAVVQEIMATIFDVPNLWTLRRGTDAASEFVESYGTHYRDYACYDNCTLSRLKGTSNDNIFVIGADPICIECGNRHDTEDNINCCTGNRYVCPYCGYSSYDSEDFYSVNGTYYCGECVTYCDICNEYHINSHMYYLDSENVNVCDSCLHEYFTRCSCCGEYINNDDIQYVESAGDYICDDCISNNYTECVECGELFRNDLLREYKGNYYCDHCYEEQTEVNDAE